MTESPHHSPRKPGCRPEGRRTDRKVAPRREDTFELDDLDYRILHLMQQSSGLTQASLAEAVGLSLSGLKRRVRKLEARRVIKDQGARLDADAVGLKLLCFVHVALAHNQPGVAAGFRDAIARVPEVLECHAVTGEQDCLLKVVARDNRHLQQVLEGQLATIPGVDRLLTSIVLEEIKATSVLPIAAPEE